MRNWLNRLWKQLPRTTGRGARRPSYRPSVESLEHRLVPAYNLTIGGGATVGVVHDAAGNFTANATGANIFFGDVLKDLQAGKSVHISDGGSGTEAGDITWLAGSNLDYRGIGAGGLGLTISADRSATGGNVTLNSSVLDSVAPADTLAVTVSARGNLQVNNSILAGAAPVSLSADVNPDGSGNAGHGVLGIGPGVTVRGSTVMLRGADVNIDTGGNPATVTATGGSQTYLATPFANPSAVVVDAHGNLYFASPASNTVNKLTPAGVLTTWSGFIGPGTVAVDTRGNVYVTNYFGGSVSKITPAGVVLTFATGFSNPNGLTFDARGNLYVANFGANTVVEAGPDGMLVTTYTGFHGPYGLAFDSQGNLLVANNASASFARLNVGGVTVRSSLPVRPIQVGGGATVAGVNLSFAELARILAPGSLTVGDPTQTGTITLNNVSLAVESFQVVESTTGPGRIVLDDAFQTLAVADSRGAVSLTAGTGGIQAVHTAPGTTDIFAALLQLTTPGSVGSLVQPLSVYVTDLGPGAVKGSLFLSDRSPLTTGGPLTVGVSAYLTLLDNFFSHAGDIVARAINLTFLGNQDELFDGGGQVFSNVIHKGTGTLRLVGDGLTDKGNLTNAPGAGNFDANDLPVTVTGLTTIDGGIYVAGAGTQVFTGGLAVNAAFVGGSGTVTTGGVTISLYGTFIAPTTTLFDTGNWTDAGGIFDANGGTVVFSGNTTQTIDAGWQDFNNVTHTGKGVLSLVLSPLTVDGALTNAPGAGIIQTNGLVLTVLNMM